MHSVIVAVSFAEAAREKRRRAELPYQPAEIPCLEGGDTGWAKPPDPLMGSLGGVYGRLHRDLVTRPVIRGFKIHEGLTVHISDLVVSRPFRDIDSMRGALLALTTCEGFGKEPRRQYPRLFAIQIHHAKPPGDLPYL